MWIFNLFMVTKHYKDKADLKPTISAYFEKTVTLDVEKF